MFEKLKNVRTFCFKSHPFDTYRYKRSTKRNSLQFSRTLDSALTLPAACQCAGSKLAAHLNRLGYFRRPEAEDPANQAERNSRVKCFAERWGSEKHHAKGDKYEVNHGAAAPSEQAGTEPPLPVPEVNVFRVAESCSTCQVMIQSIWGNEILLDQGNACTTNKEVIPARMTVAQIAAEVTKAVAPGASPIIPANVIAQALNENNAVIAAIDNVVNGNLADPGQINAAVTGVLTTLNVNDANIISAVTDAMASNANKILAAKVANNARIHNAREAGRVAAVADMNVRMSMFTHRRSKHLWGCSGESGSGCHTQSNPVCSIPRPVTIELIGSEEYMDEGAIRGCSGANAIPQHRRRSSSQKHAPQ